MTPMRAGLAVVAVMALAWGPARAGQSSRLDCPSAAATQRLDRLEDQIGLLQDRLESLDERLDQLADQRRDALDNAKDRIETAVHDESLSPEQRDRQVARALAEAEARGQATAEQAKTLHRSMSDLKGRIEMLRQQQRKLATHAVASNDDAG